MATHSDSHEIHSDISTRTFLRSSTDSFGTRICIDRIDVFVCIQVRQNARTHGVASREAETVGLVEASIDIMVRLIDVYVVVVRNEAER